MKALHRNRLRKMYKNHGDAHIYSTLVEKNLNVQITKKEATAGELKKQTYFITV